MALRTVGVLGHLLGEEIVRLQGDAGRDLGVGAQGPGRALDRLWEVLDHELHVAVLGGQADGHEAVGPANVDKGAAGGVEVAQVVPALFDIDEERGLVPLAARQAGHGAPHAAGSGRVLAEGGEHGLLVDRVEGELEAGAGQGRCLRVGLERLQDVAGCPEDVLAVEADPGLHVLVLGEDAGRGGVGDHAGGGLAKDTIGHGETEQAGEVDGV